MNECNGPVNLNVLSHYCHKQTLRPRYEDYTHLQVSVLLSAVICCAVGLVLYLMGKSRLKDCKRCINV